ncbi:hypothetical protein SCATT_57160 [Streptantibioticus cattleyicolor NRRL 8057 = DSM 46488]|uniref:Carboxymuconolactone decarboxylase-like domain-containing protein n=1 Tax=Streptantibioticus cattleyicolor (strain ATCC 35852 / DSM 46488 / JCM 4925 / NBRC 14057 / NRRL 8057) TaxID=1003195 RepID=F8JT02_STREN|nr:hypothetical protein SCATT_57160 [Streptantibioticus cattleyicolor NRRL 8057 = DSM 46488]MYS62481.1 carboxymuconolactone decarboxylase family protein [Streptomyces sp. SID5468]CCB78403.1 protein of unknown function [Streptantibioticus cattleyicolor NRRL 8057 = DSM 46488]
MTATTSISRMPNPAEFVPELNDISAAMFRATGNRSVARTTVSLVHLRAGQIVGNTYLTVLNTGFLRKAGVSEERITAVASWQDATCFTDAERAALAGRSHPPARTARPGTRHRRTVRRGRPALRRQGPGHPHHRHRPDRLLHRPGRHRQAPARHLPRRPAVGLTTRSARAGTRHRAPARPPGHGIRCTGTVARW